MLSSTATRGSKRVDGLELEAGGLDDAGAAGRRPPASPPPRPAARPGCRPTNVGRPVARIMSPTSVVVVDLPLVPVIAISVLDTKRDASSISPVIGHAGRARRGQLGDLGDARRQHDQLGAGERLAPVAAQLARDAGRQPGQRGAQRAPARACRSRSRARRAPRTAAPPRSRSARDRPRARVCRSDPSVGSHLTFRVVMRPRIAQANETIQKRTTILDSGQPSFSKWWWIGAIRKMRFLVFL